MVMRLIGWTLASLLFSNIDINKVKIYVQKEEKAEKEKDPKEVSILGYTKGGMHGRGARKHPKEAKDRPLSKKEKEERKRKKWKYL